MAQQKNEAQSTRRPTDSESGTVIGKGITIRGELVSDEAVDLAGTVEGRSTVAGHYRVRAGGCVLGEVEARTMAVEGSVESPDLVADRLEIGASGRLGGCVRARIVTMVEGASFEGELEMPGSFDEPKR
jgi:cytoskeletal protein CcmA (bactofilin family)